jgi:hypothetical protein
MSLPSCSEASISVTVTRAPGTAARKRAKHAGKKLKFAGPIAARRNSPASPPAASRPRFTAVSAAANTCRDSRRNTEPASVSATWLRSRSNRRKPSSSSRSRICVLKEGCARCNRTAARLKLSSSPTATNSAGGEVPWVAAYSFCLSREKEQNLIEFFPDNLRAFCTKIDITIRDSNPESPQPFKYTD